MRAARTIRFVLASLAMMAAPAWAQSLPDTLFTPSTRLELERIIDTARAAGLPTTPLVNRALQGAARRVDGQRVVGIVRAYADSMQVALTLLSPGASPSEIDAGAAALRAGVQHDGIRRVRAARGSGQGTTALVVLTDLVRRGVPAGDAADAVGTLASRQTDQALLSLQSTIARTAGVPSNAQLRDAVQRHLRQPVPPEHDSGDALVQALDLRTSPHAGHRAWLGLSALDAARAAGGVGGGIEGGFALARGEGLSATLGGRAGRDAMDSLVMQVRGGLALLRRTGPRSAVAGWLGVESRPMSLGASWTARPDSNRLGAGPARDSLRHRRGLAIVGGASAARAFRPRLALGALFQVEADQIATRSRRPLYPGAASEHSLPDTLPYIESVAAAQRLFVHTGLSAVIGSLGIHGTVTHRLVGPRVSGDPGASRSLLNVAVEQQVMAGMSGFVSLSSRAPSSVLGAVLPTEGRVRVGARIVERQRLRTPGELATAAAVPLAITVERVTRDDGARSVRVSLRAPGARAAWVQGDFTAWLPVRLTVGPDGRFGGTFDAESDVVRFRLRVDDGPWRVPPGLPVDWDDFGGEVGVAVVR